MVIGEGQADQMEGANKQNAGYRPKPRAADNLENRCSPALPAVKVVAGRFRKSQTKIICSKSSSFPDYVPM